MAKNKDKKKLKKLAKLEAEKKVQALAELEASMPILGQVLGLVNTLGAVTGRMTVDKEHEGNTPKSISDFMVGGKEPYFTPATDLVKMFQLPNQHDNGVTCNLGAIKYDPVKNHFVNPMDIAMNKTNKELQDIELLTKAIQGGRKFNFNLEDLIKGAYYEKTLSNGITLAVPMEQLEGLSDEEKQKVLAEIEADALKRYGAFNESEEKAEGCFCCEAEGAIFGGELGQNETEAKTVADWGFGEENQHTPPPFGKESVEQALEPKNEPYPISLDTIDTEGTVLVKPNVLDVITHHLTKHTNYTEEDIHAVGRRTIDNIQSETVEDMLHELSAILEEDYHYTIGDNYELFEDLYTEGVYHLVRKLYIDSTTERYVKTAFTLTDEEYQEYVLLRVLMKLCLDNIVEYEEEMLFNVGGTDNEIHRMGLGHTLQQEKYTKMELISYLNSLLN